MSRASHDMPSELSDRHKPYKYCSRILAAIVLAIMTELVTSDVQSPSMKPLVVYLTNVNAENMKPQAKVIGHTTVYHELTLP